MRAHAVLILLSVYVGVCFSQNVSAPNSVDQASVARIDGYLKSGDYLSALRELNYFIPRNPTNGYLYYVRGIANLNLNNRSAAEKDLLLARQTGYREGETIIDYFTSKRAMAEMFLKNLKLDAELDSARGFKIRIQPSDTLQGGIRPERTCYDVFFYDLSVKVIPENQSIEGSNTIWFTTISGTRRLQFDLFPNYEITSVKLDESTLKYDRLFGAVFVDTEKRLEPGEKHSLTVTYRGKPRVAPKAPWNGGFVWDKEKGRYHIGVACEHLGASSWWPCKDHLSDKPDSMRINLQVPAGYQGISNGNLRSVKDLGNMYTNFEWFVSYPINTYNVTLYIGDFVNFTEEYSNSLGKYNIDYYVLPKNLEKAKKYYAQTKEIIKIYEDLFGEYPFMRDGAAMVEAPFAGMEHQGAIAIGGDYGKENKKMEMWPEKYDYLLVHETGHEWWGNAVAIGDMADAWINEGFTTFAECLLAEKASGYTDYLKMIASKQRSINNLYPVVGERNINENTFLSGDIYNKGAAMLNNLRCILDNDSLFFRIIKDYYNKYKFRITTTEDFLKLVHEYSGLDLDDFFRKFLYDAEPPVLFCTYELDNKGNLKFTYQWTKTGPKFTMPFCICLNGKEVIRLNGTTSSQTFRAEKVKSFNILNENTFNERLTVPRNAFTYYYTSWPMI